MIIKKIKKIFLNRVKLDEIDTRFLLNKLNISDLSEGDLKFLFEKFHKEIRDYYINQSLPQFKIKQSDDKTIESLASLYESEDYRILARLLCNKKYSVAKMNLMKDPTPDKSNDYWKGYYRGKSHLISHILTLIKYVHTQWKEEENKKGNK